MLPLRFTSAGSFSGAPSSSSFTLRARMLLSAWAVPSTSTVCPTLRSRRLMGWWLPSRNWVPASVLTVRPATWRTTPLMESMAPRTDVSCRLSSLLASRAWLPETRTVMVRLWPSLRGSTPRWASTCGPSKWRSCWRPVGTPARTNRPAASVVAESDTPVTLTFIPVARAMIPGLPEPSCTVPWMVAPVALGVPMGDAPMGFESFELQAWVSRSPIPRPSEGRIQRDWSDICFNLQNGPSLLIRAASERF